MNPWKVNVEADTVQNFLWITPDEGELFEFDQIQVIQFGRVGKDPDFCSNQYLVDKTQFVLKDGLWAGVEVALTHLNPTMPKITISF